MRKLFTSFLFITTSFCIFGIFNSSQAVSDQKIPQIYHLPGQIQDTGTYFEIKDSRYLNIAIDSTQEVKLRVESAPKMIIINIERVASTTTQTRLTIKNLVPSTKYYLYTDNYHNLTEFIADRSGAYAFTQDISQSHLIIIQTRKGTKFISDNATGGDCVSIGNWDLSTKTCALTQNVYETIQIDSDNITLDGNGHYLGNQDYKYELNGVFLSGRSNVTIKNLNIRYCSYGIWAYISNRHNFSNNSITNNDSGIALEPSGYSQIAGNNISNNYNGLMVYGDSFGDVFTNNILRDNYWYGMLSVNNSGETLRGNVIEGSRNNLDIESPGSVSFSIDTTNLVNGKPVYYLVNQNNLTIDSAWGDIGYLGIVNSSNIVIKDITLPSNNGQGVLLAYSNNIRVENVKSQENRYGFYLFRSFANTLVNNTATSSFGEGFYLLSSNDNILTGNSAPNILSSFSNNNTFADNTFYGSYGYAANFGYSRNNKIYNNNFINGAAADYPAGSGNLFNLDLPVGGNYWGNFDAPDEGCNDLNNDNICDAPYVFSGNQDNLPWKIKDGWELGPLPTISNLQQFKSDGQTAIQESATTTENSTVFKANVSSPQNHDVQLHVELRQFSEPFTGLDDGGIIKSDFVNSGNIASITRPGLNDGQYKWRARAVDNQGNKSDWQEFGTSGNIDFIVDYVRDINIAVILAEPSDKSFEPGHDKAYFETQIISQVQDYWCEVSFGKRNPDGSCSGGKVNLNFKVFDDDEKIYKLSSSLNDYGENFFPWLFWKDKELNFGLDGKDRIFTIPHSRDNTQKFIWDAVNAADNQIDYNQFDVIIAVHPGQSEQAGSDEDISTQYWHPRAKDSTGGEYPVALLGTPTEYIKSWISIAESDLNGAWAHELGHAMGDVLVGEMLCDFYESFYGLLGSKDTCGNLKEWDLMAYGDKLGTPSGSIPSHLSSYNKIKLGWLRVTPIGYGNYDIESLETKNFGEAVKKYELPKGAYYLLEARTNRQEYSRWDRALSKDALLVYKVSPKIITKDGVTITKDIVNIRRNLDLSSSPFLDLENDLSVYLNDFSINQSNFKANIDVAKSGFRHTLVASLKPGLLIFQNISEPDSPHPGSGPTATTMKRRWYTDFLILIDDILWGLSNSLGSDYPSYPLFVVPAFLILASWLLLRLRLPLRLRHRLRLSQINPWLSKSFIILSYLGIILSVIFLVLFAILFVFVTMENIRVYAQENNPNQAIISAPDLDLHAITPDGKHVGINYQTGEYENQIPNTIASGDLIYDDEWIAVPEGTEVKFYTSSHDIQQFLEQNPGISQQLPSTQESYTLSAIYYDANSQKYESAPLADQAINPGQNIYYQTQGTTDISISPVPTSETSLSYEGDASGFFSDKINFKAKLTDGSGQGISDKTINFSLFNQFLSALTDSQGLASATLTINSIPKETTETHKITIFFAGDDQYSASQIQADFTLKSAKWLKQQTLSDLQNAKTGDKKINQKLDSAINLVNKSLDNDLWQDSSRLNYLTKGVCFDSEILQFNPDSVDLEKLFELTPQNLETKANSLFKGKCSKQKLGITIFHNEKTAVALMSAIQKQAPALREIINKLAKADGLLAKVSLFDAKNTPIKNPKLTKTVENRIKKAETEIVNAERELNKNRPAKAIARFAKSWLHSQLAIRLANQQPRTAVDDEKYSASVWEDDLLMMNIFKQLQTIIGNLFFLF